MTGTDGLTPTAAEGITPAELFAAISPVVQSAGLAVLAVAAAFAMLALYVGVPALLGRLLGVRIERVSLGLPPALLRYRPGPGLAELAIGCLPVAAHTKFYGEEGVFGLRREEWAPHREEALEDDEDADGDFDDGFGDPSDEDPDGPGGPGADGSGEEPAEPPPPDSFVAAHPLVRAGLAASGPLALVALGVALIAASASVPGPSLTLALRRDASGVPRTLPAAPPWSELPLFADWVALPSDALPPRPAPVPAASGEGGAGTAAEPPVRSAFAERDAAPPDRRAWPALVADGVVRLATFSASAEGYAGYLSWPVLLVKSPSVSPAFALSMFGLFACLLGTVNLLPLPVFNGGVAVVCLWEYAAGRRPSRGGLALLRLFSLLWILAVILQLIVIDVDRWFG